MYTGFSNGIGKNQMITPPTFALTQSLISDAIDDLGLNNNSNDLFHITVDGVEVAKDEVTGEEANIYIQPTLDVPIKAKNFTITAEDSDIVADENNACSVKIVRGFIDDIDDNLLNNYMTEAECDSKYLTKNGWNGSYSDPATAGYSKTEVDNTFSTISTVNTLSNNLNTNYYTKTACDSTFATQTTVNTINNNLTNNYYTKTQVDNLIEGIDIPENLVTEEELEEALEPYATKTYVDNAIESAGNGGLITISIPIETNSLSVTVADGATTGHTSNKIAEIPLSDTELNSTIQVEMNCTITSNNTDITHDLDNYTFQIKDQGGTSGCVLAATYETDTENNNTEYTKLKGEYTVPITSSNNELYLYIERTASTPAETIVLTATDTNIGTILQTVDGYITKTYADEHYASKDKPTTVNITEYDYSTHTSKKTTYDFGPDFSINFDGELAFKVTLKVGGSPTVQMATAAITTALQFGLDQIGGGDDAYTMDIYNAIGLEQVNALSNFSNWIQNYSRYSDVDDISLDNFVITAALAESRYLKPSSLVNYYTKTETDSAISTAISNIPTPTINKLQWTSGNYTYKLEPETVTSQGETITMLNFKRESTTLARVISNGTVHADKFNPKTAIVFGQNIDGTSQLNQWSGTISNIANDNYDATTYASADLDTIVPSLKFLNNQHYTKTQVDSAITTGIGALSNTYVTKTNPGTLTGNLTVNGEIYTSSITTTGDINLTQGAILDASGDAQIGGDLTVDGQTNLNGDLMVNANMTVSNNAQFDDTVIIDGTTTINNDCNVNGCFTLDGDLNITNSGALDVIGSSTFHYDVTCNDILTVDSTLYTNDFVATGIVEFRTNDILIGTNGNTININKAFFDSITGPTPCSYAFNSWNVRNNKFTANTNFTDDVCSFTMANGSIIGYGGRVGFKIRIVFYLTDSTQKASALNSLKFRLESRVANHYNDIRVYGEPDEVYDENSSNYYDDRICVNFIGVWIDLTTSSSPSPLMGVRYKNTLSSDINLSASPMDITVRVWKL